MRQPRYLMSILTLFLFFVFFFPSDALAVQVHGPPEGYLVHLMGHIFFTAALVFLIYILHKYPLDSSLGWKYFKVSIFFWLIWNLDTFVVHILDARLPKEAIVTGHHIVESRLKGPFDLERLVYYLGKFDHLLCLPAAYCYAMSLRQFCKRIEKEMNSSGSDIRLL